MLELMEGNEMSIVKTEPDIDPADLEKGQGIKVFSDAPNNLHALFDMVKWVSEHGLWKEEETHLRCDGSLRWGWCFRPTDEDVKNRLDVSEEISQRVREMPLTRPSYEILEEGW